MTTFEAKIPEGKDVAKMQTQTDRFTDGHSELQKQLLCLKTRSRLEAERNRDTREKRGRETQRETGKDREKVEPT